jgi:hypothetical protein
MNNLNPKYPIYIVSKGRWESRLTAKALENIKVPYYIVVEKQEYDKYCSVTNPKKGTVLILPQKYLDEYDTCDDLGNTKSKGPGGARNFCWDHSIQLGFKRHWVMDDNISAFCRLNKNRKIRVYTGAMIRAAEDFVDRYENVPLAGLNYRFFAPERDEQPAFRLNTRIYSCLLVENASSYRWRGRYNEDTDISLRMLNDGYCTILFQAFLCDKLGTQKLKGGNTEAFYAHEGTYNKSKMQVDLHPELSSLVWRFGRWHHYVDYRPFKKNKLILRKDIKIEEGINNYGMKLVRLEDLKQERGENVS